MFDNNIPMLEAKIKDIDMYLDCYSEHITKQEMRKLKDEVNTYKQLLRTAMIKERRKDFHLIINRDYGK